VASVTPFKGYHHLVDAVARLPEHLKSSVHVIGLGEVVDESYAAFVRTRAADLGVCNFELLGWRADPSDVYAAADVLVLPSVERERLVTDYGAVEIHGNEGLPRALLEGMAHGLPVVASEIAGMRDIVQSGSNGYLVPPGNATALANALSSLLGDAEQRSRMGQQALAAAERLSGSGCVRKIVEEYRALLAAPRLLPQHEAA
jgi:glycosyltransferase involved in cell wall biosynthesis